MYHLLPVTLAHFVSHIVNKDTLGEKNVRDAMHETDAVLDHYLFHDNTAPFLCNRIMQRFGLVSTSRSFTSEFSHSAHCSQILVRVM